MDAQRDWQETQRFGIFHVSAECIEDDLAPPQPANSGREINFETLRAWAPEGAVIRENDVAAVFTNLPPILKNFHHPESLP